MAPGPLVVLPLGATEQHGPHLPVDTDTRLAVAAARVLVARFPVPGEEAGAPGTPRAAVLLDPQAVGASGEHAGFAGTVSVGTEVLTALVVEVGRSVRAWAGRLLIVNAHGGNVEALRRAVPLLRAEGSDAAWLACRTAESDADTHAGHVETSLLLHLAPELVHMERARPGCTRPLAEIMPELRAGGLAAVSPSGVLGDPTTATVAEGRRLWRELSTDATSRFGRWTPGDDGMLR